MNRDVRVSKLLSLVLRHQPGLAGVTLDRQGWADVEELLVGLAARGIPLTHAELEGVVAGDDKQRFVLAGGRIRAQQGHTVPVDLGLPAVAPPPQLFHGTTRRFLPRIRVEGLVPRGRHHVHLSPDEATARRVGARRGEAIVLVVAAGALHAAGHVFHQTGNGVWLTAAVPPGYLGELP